MPNWSRHAKTRLRQSNSLKLRQQAIGSQWLRRRQAAKRGYCSEGHFEFAFLEGGKQPEQATKKLEHPDALHFKGIDLTPGGFFAAETVDRQRGIGGDVNTQFNGIPFAGQTAGVPVGVQCQRPSIAISLLAVGKLPSATLRGYVETDFSFGRNDLER